MNNKTDKGSACYKEQVFVKVSDKSVRVNIHDIAFLEAQQNYCAIHLLNGNVKSMIMVTVPMCEVMEDLNPDLFVRIHRSYVVNTEHVIAIAAYMVMMDNGKDLNIGREFRNNLDDMFVFIGTRKRVKENRHKMDCLKMDD